MENENEIIDKEIKIQQEYIKKIKEKYNISDKKYIDRLEEFYKKRNYLTSMSREKIENERRENIARLRGYPTRWYSEIRLDRDIDADISYYLRIHGFNIKEKGTQYLSELIKTMYHERNLYNSIEEDEFNYFDLDDYENIHYQYFNEDKILIIAEIKKSIVNSSPNSIRLSINDIVYSVADQEIKYADPYKNIKKYKK